MIGDVLAAPGGGPDIPVWGQVVFAVMWAGLAVSMLVGWVRKRRRRSR